MTVKIGEDPALPEAEIDECEAVIACLGDDAELLRRDNPDCEIAANMDAAANMLKTLRERLSRAEHWAKHAMLMRSAQNVELLGILRGDCGEAGHDQGKCGNYSCLGPNAKVSG